MKRYASMRLFTALTLLVMSGGCKDDDQGPRVKEPAVLAIENAAIEPLVVSLTSPKTQVIDIRVVARQISGHYVTVTFKTDPALVEAYNQTHGTSYQLVPADAYQLTNDEVMLPRYNTISTTMKVKLLSEKMPDLEPYLLPISIDQISGDTRATKDQTGSVFYILFNKVEKPGPPDPVLLNRTNWKMLFAAKTKPGYEMEKMFDEDINTFGYCNADEEKADPPYDFVIDLGKEVTVRGLQFGQRYMTTGKPEEGARYGIAHMEVYTAKSIIGDGLGEENIDNWTYRQEYQDYRTNPESPLDPMGVIINPMLTDYQHARYVRIRIHSSYTNKTFNPTFRGWCIAEMNVWGNTELLE